MKFFTFFLLVVIVGLGGYSGFFYLTEYRPMNDKVESLKNENRTLTELITRLKEQIDERKDVETGDSYKKSVIEELSKISTKESFEIKRAEKGVEISLPGIRLFNPGEDKLSSEGLLLLSKLGKILKNATSEEILVEGHTDDTKISGPLLTKYPTNWELSAARAINVVRYLQEETKIRPERLAVVAYGQYRPILPNDNEDHRRKNRRIVLVIETPKEVLEEEPEIEEEIKEEEGKGEMEKEDEGEKKIIPKPVPGEGEGETEGEDSPTKPNKPEEKGEGGTE
jgi:flagellar motor protein MotB